MLVPNFWLVRNLMSDVCSASDTTEAPETKTSANTEQGKKGKANGLPEPEQTGEPENGKRTKEADPQLRI